MTQWIADVSKHPNQASFPATGTADVWYADMSTASDDDGTGANLYYWTGAQYNVVVGPHPRPH